MMPVPENYRVTHVYRRPVESGHWIALTFVGTRNNGQTYDLALESRPGWSPQEIEETTRRGILYQLPEPTRLPDNNCLWLTSKGSIVISSIDNPLDYNRQQHIGELPPFP